MRKKMIKALLSVSLAAVVALAGCSSKVTPGATGTSNPTSNEPITLFFYTAQNSVYATEEGFEDQIGKYIKKKFPYITIEHVHKAKSLDYTDLITSGKIPDIILETPGFIQNSIINNGLENDLAGLAKKNNMDLNKFNPAVINQIKYSNLEGQLLSIPFTLSNMVMFYNKDLFDKFGVPYPKNGMTYDETYELAKRLTRTEGGVVYKGFSAHPGLMLNLNQLSLSPLSPKEDKADINNASWRKLVDNFVRFYQIPNNEFTNIDDFPKATFAMAVHVSEKISSWYDANKSLNFDLVSPPSFADVPKKGFQPNAYALFISKQSKYKDQAFQVINYLTSEEVQSELSKKGIVTPLESKVVHQLFGQDVPQLKGKNTQALFYSENAQPPAPRAAGLVSYGVNTFRIIDLIVKEGKDVNTALRTVEEESNAKITELKAAKK